MKTLYICLIGILVFLILAYGLGYIPIDYAWANSLQAIGGLGALIASIVALFYVKMEYDHRKQNAKTTLLCKYLQRYTNEPYTKKIADYIVEMALLDNNGAIIGFDSSKKAKEVPTIWEKETFMHFFEEIQLLIDDGMLDKDVVIKFTGYYVGIFHIFEEFHKDITDYNDVRYWEYYLKFVNSIPKDFLTTQ